MAPIKIKKQRKTFIFTTGILLVLDLLIVGSFLFYGSIHSQDQRRSFDAIDKSVSDRIAYIESKKKEPVYIKLPGADQFRAIVEDYGNPSSIWYIVNKSIKIPDAYTPADLGSIGVQNTLNNSGLIRKVAVSALNKMFDASIKDGRDLLVVSAYRTSDQQKRLLDSYIESIGLNAATDISAKPGHSEHQLGLAVDINTNFQGCLVGGNCFLSDNDAKWLADNSYKYGFILRYPEGKEGVTGYRYEPWHFRYVGVDLATALRQSNLTLEEANPHLKEALETLKNNWAIQR